MSQIVNKPDLMARQGKYGNGYDIKLSVKQYQEIIDVLLDQFISRNMMMNFKNASNLEHFSWLIIPIVTTPISYFLSRIPFLFYKRQADMRMFGPIFFLTHGLVVYHHFHKPRPRHLFTKILADPTWDGQYIRNQVAIAKPELWKQLSRDLYRRGYYFPEMLEYQENTEFSGNFVDPL